MKRFIRLSAPLALALALSPLHATAAAWTEGMKDGKLELKSAGPLAFGPQGIDGFLDKSQVRLEAMGPRDKRLVLGRMIAVWTSEQAFWVVSSTSRSFIWPSSGRSKKPP